MKETLSKVTETKLDPTDIAILRESVRLSGLNEVTARRINVGIQQVAKLESRGLLAIDENRSLWCATAAGRQAINA